MVPRPFPAPTPPDGEKDTAAVSLSPELLGASLCSRLSVVASSLSFFIISRSDLRARTWNSSSSFAAIFSNADFAVSLSQLPTMFVSNPDLWTCSFRRLMISGECRAVAESMTTEKSADASFLALTTSSWVAKYPRIRCERKKSESVKMSGLQAPNHSLQRPLPARLVYVCCEQLMPCVRTQGPRVPVCHPSVATSRRCVVPARTRTI